MSDKLFHAISGRIDSPEITADFEHAEKYDRIRVGKAGVYFRDGFKTVFLDYASMERVFIRIQEVNLKTCCGGSTAAYYKLVFVVGGKELCMVFMEKENAADAALAAIHEAAPLAAIGTAAKT